MRAYKHLVGYLERYTLINFKRVHVRLHRIKRPDITPFLHSHPFHYLSIVLWGGYTECLENGEVKTHGFLSLIPRNANVAHRIMSVKPGTLTLFCTWKTRDQQWTLKEGGEAFSSPEWVNHPTGVYQRQLYGKTQYSKFNKFWHKAAKTYDEALGETRPSIDQSTPGVLVQ